MIFDCPECETPIIGEYRDLLAHVRDEHPLVKIRVDENGETVLDRIKKAQKERLKNRINEEMVVGDE